MSAPTATSSARAQLSRRIVPVPGIVRLMFSCVIFNSVAQFFTKTLRKYKLWSEAIAVHELVIDCKTAADMVVTAKEPAVGVGATGYSMMVSIMDICPHAELGRAALTAIA